MERIAIHDYRTCAEQDNVDTFWGPDAAFQKGLTDALGDYGDVDWNKWVNDTPFWVTEVSCALNPWGITNIQACEALTGQGTGKFAPSKYGTGGIDSW